MTITSVIRVAIICFTPLIGMSSWHFVGLGNEARAQRAQPDADQIRENDKVGGADAAHKGVSSAVQASSDWLDSFFGDESFEVENNKTRLKLRLGTFAEEGRGIGYTAKVGLKLVLPKTGKRLSLLIGGDADDDSALENTSEDDVREEAVNTDEENVAIGLQYFLHRSTQSNLSTSARVRLSGTTPIGSLRGRYRHSLQPDPWLAEFTQRLQWLTENEFVIPSRLEFERPLSENLLFKTTLQGTWFEIEDGYFYDVNFAVRQRLGSDRAVRFEWSNQFRTEPNNRIDETTLRVRYRQVVWREWIKFDLTPQLSFPRDRDFDITPGIFAGIEISFGG